MEETMQDHTSHPCPACQVGRLHLKPLTYTHVYYNTLVSVPNTPARVCDFCHAIEYDQRALSRIEALVGQAGPPPNRARRQPGITLRAKPRALPPGG
jgi:YgiT-type zinc finger domain-containing protein